MAIKINQQIVGYEVAKPTTQTEGQATKELQETETKVVRMTEKVERPEFLAGSTYKVKSPLFDHALYITINDIVLNRGTEHELRRPFEIFINSKNMDHFQWIVALTRIMSAVFRKGGDVTFLVEEMKAVFDPRGGYFKSGGRFMPSIVAEIGEVLETHLKRIGLMHDEDELTPQQRELLLAKQAEFESKARAELPVEDSGFPSEATVCNKCSTKAVIIMDNCETCLNCGESKCG